MGGVLDSPRRRHYAGCLPILLLSTVGVLAISGLLTYIFDRQCHHEAETLLPAYPNATLEDMSFTFMRPYGVGTTTMAYFTSDNVQDVREYYIDQAVLAEEQYDMALGTTLANMQRRFVDMRDGSGTRIQFVAVCARPLDLSSIGITRANILEPSDEG